MSSKRFPKKRKTIATITKSLRKSTIKRTCVRPIQFEEDRESTQSLPSCTHTQSNTQSIASSFPSKPLLAELKLNQLPQSPILMTTPTKYERVHLRSLQHRMNVLLNQMRHQSVNSEAGNSQEVCHLLELAVIRLHNQVRTYNVLVSRNVVLNQHIQHLGCVDHRCDCK